MKSVIKTSNWEDALTEVAYGALRDRLSLTNFLAEAEKHYLAVGAAICETLRELKEERTTEITDSVDLSLPYEEQKIQIVRAAIDAYGKRFPHDPRQPILERSYHEHDDGVIHLRDGKDSGNSYEDDCAIFMVYPESEETPPRMSLEFHSSYHNKR